MSRFTDDEFNLPLHLMPFAWHDNRNLWPAGAEINQNQNQFEDQFAKGWNAAMSHVRDFGSCGRLSDLAIRRRPQPSPVRVIFNNPATIVYWDDGTKTVVKCQPGDVFSAETGLTTAMLKRFMGNDNTFNKAISYLLANAQYTTPPALPSGEE